MRKKVFILSFIFIIAVSFFDHNFSFAKKNTDIINEIVVETEASVTEYGVRSCIKTDNDGETFSLEIFRKLNIWGLNTNVVKDKNLFCIEFNNESINGYIENMKYENYNIVTINIIEKGTVNGIAKLRTAIEKALGDYSSKAKYYQYLKAEIPNKDISKTNENIKNLLKGYGAVNINTIDIDNGFSTIAYTKRYPVIRNNGKYMDFNYAVCSYSSGNYIIIGTPIIISTY